MTEPFRPKRAHTRSLPIYVSVLLAEISVTYPVIPPLQNANN